MPAAVRDESNCKYGSGSKRSKWTVVAVWPIYLNNPKMPTTTGGTAILNFTWISNGHWHGGTDSYPNVFGITFTDDKN